MGSWLNPARTGVVFWRWLPRNKSYRTISLKLKVIQFRGQPISALFDNMWTPKFKDQPTNALFRYSQSCSTTPLNWLPTATGHAVIKSLNTVQTTGVGKDGPPNIWLTVEKDAFVVWALNFRSWHVIERRSMNYDKLTWDKMLHIVKSEF